MCKLFSSQKNKSKLLLWASDTHYPHYLKCPQTGFIFSTSIFFTVISFVFLLLHQRILHAQNMVSENHFPLNGIRFLRKWLISGLGQEMHRWDQFILSECGKASRVQEVRVLSKDSWTNWRGPTGQRWDYLRFNTGKKYSGWKPHQIHLSPSVHNDIKTKTKKISLAAFGY